MPEIRLKLTPSTFIPFLIKRRNKTILEVWKSSGTIFTSVNSEKVPALIPKISSCGQVHTRKGLYLPGHSPAGPAGFQTPQERQNWKKKAFSAFEQQEQKISFPTFSHTQVKVYFSNPKVFICLLL